MGDVPLSTATHARESACGQVMPFASRQPDSTSSSTDKVARIRSLLVQGTAWLAPMAGVGDGVFRGLARERGCSLAYSEMVSATGMAYNSTASARLYRPGVGEGLLAVQVFGADPERMAAAAFRIEDELGDRLAFIDINMGCPVSKVTRKGEGSALMRDPMRAAAIVAAVDRAVSVPVSVKFRRGWSLEEADTVGFALSVQDAGAALVAVHGRTAGQLYRGVADWGCIADVKRALDIPVLGNGDIVSAQIAVDRMEQTLVDGVLIGRAARGNPWIFSQIRDVRSGRVPMAPTIDDRFSLAREHVRRYAAVMGDPSRCNALRKNMMWYLAGLPDAAALRGKVTGCITEADFLAFLERAYEHIKGGYDD